MTRASTPRSGTTTTIAITIAITSATGATTIGATTTTATTIRGAVDSAGLAKKPGGMPPGQYKKLYNAGQGASVLSDVLGRHGYSRRADRGRRRLALRVLP